MKRTLPIVAAALTMLWAGHADAATSTAPRQVKSTSVLYATDVAATVTVDRPSTITLTNLAYRHAEELQATVVTTTAGVYEIRDRCKPITLLHTWRVFVDGVLVASTTGLRCE